MLKHVHITNFKSLESVAVDLSPVTVLIGRSGSGKSNFVEALRWLRDYLTLRDDSKVQRMSGGWDRLLCATASRPLTLSFQVKFAVPGISGDFQYLLRFRQEQQRVPLQLSEEMLSLNNRTLFHQNNNDWVKPPTLLNSPGPGTLMLGALTGIEEVTIAHLVLTNGIGCYAFPDRVLISSENGAQEKVVGLADNAANFVQALNDISVNLSTWHRLREMAAALRRLKSTLKSIDLQQPGRNQVVVSLENAGRLLNFDVAQESEGFRRLLACLLALYQSPPKQTVIFDEPEKGIYPVGLEILADEFKGYADQGRGQILLTTHSPEFLDQFEPEQIRVVEMRGFTTHIGPVAPEQMQALKEHFLRPSDLLTIDEARLEGSLVGTE